MRNALRIFDFENTKEIIGDKDWDTLVVNQGNFCVHSIIFATMNFIDIRFKALTNMTFFFILVFSIRIDKGEFMAYEAFWFLFIIVLSHYLSNKLNETLIMQSQIMNHNKKFKSIFDNLEESIIIIKQSNNQIEYANH